MDQFYDRISIYTFENYTKYIIDLLKMGFVKLCVKKFLVALNCYYHLA